MSTANMTVNSTEVTVLYHVSEGDSAPCEYCERAGKTQSVTIDSVTTLDNKEVDAQDRLYRAAKAKLQHSLPRDAVVCKLPECQHDYQNATSILAEAAEIVLS